MIWDEFKRSAPEMAALGEERFERTGLVLVGTIRKDGWPRISPVEPLIVDGELSLGMMWQSKNAKDLLRGPRCTVHSTVWNRDAGEGQFRVSGLAVEVLNPGQRRRYGDALFEKIQLRPEEPEYHLFSIDVKSAAFTAVRNGEMTHQVWKAA